MAARHDDIALHFQCLPNIREVQLHREGDANEDPKDVSKTSILKIYRSSRPDCITEADVNILMNDLKIKTMVDLRSVDDYAKSSGDKLLDKYYELYEVKCPTRYTKEEYVQFSKLNSESGDQENGGRRWRGNHFLINLFQREYITYIFTSAPWYMKVYYAINLLGDALLGTSYLLRAIARNNINKRGLLGLYKDIIDYSQISICAALKLLSDPENLPAVVNCAIGKDRTGVVSALILSIGGRSKEEIAKDYAKSEAGLMPIMDQLREELTQSYHLSEDFLDAKPETMLQLLDYIDERYGSVKEYLKQIGFTEAEQEKLRQNLME